MSDLLPPGYVTCDNCADLQKRLEEAHALISDAMIFDRPQEWLDRANAWFPKVEGRE